MTDNPVSPSPETMTESLRRRLRERVECPTCHQPMPGDSVTALGAAVGLSTSVVWRFLKGHDMTGRNLDKVAAYLESLRV